MDSNPKSRFFFKRKTLNIDPYNHYKISIFFETFLLILRIRLTLNRQLT